MSVNEDEGTYTRTPTKNSECVCVCVPIFFITKHPLSNDIKIPIIIHNINDLFYLKQKEIVFYS